MVVGILAGVSPTAFPRDTSGGRAWSFLLEHIGYLLHVAAGVILLADCAHVLLALLRRRGGWSSTVVLTAIASTAVLFACVSGVAYVSFRQTGGALLAMTLGWLLALLCCGVGWWHSSHVIRAAARTRQS